MQIFFLIINIFYSFICFRWEMNCFWGWVASSADFCCWVLSQPNPPGLSRISAWTKLSNVLRPQLLWCSATSMSIWTTLDWTTVNSTLKTWVRSCKDQMSAPNKKRKFAFNFRLCCLSLILLENHWVTTPTYRMSGQCFPFFWIP